MQEMGRGHRSLRTGEKEGKMPASASFLPFSLNSPQGKCVKVRFLLGRTPCVVAGRGRSWVSEPVGPFPGLPAEG